MPDHKHDFRPWHCELKGITAKKCFMCGELQHFAGNLRVYFQVDVDKIVDEVKKEMSKTNGTHQP